MLSEPISIVVCGVAAKFLCVQINQKSLVHFFPIFFLSVFISKCSHRSASPVRFWNRAEKTNYRRTSRSAASGGMQMTERHETTVKRSCQSFRGVCMCLPACEEGRTQRHGGDCSKIPRDCSSHNWGNIWLCPALADGGLRRDAKGVGGRFTSIVRAHKLHKETIVPASCKREGWEKKKKNFSFHSQTNRSGN